MTFFCDFSRADCSEENSEDEENPYVFYKCGVYHQCPSGTAFDSSEHVCTESKWKELQDQPSDRSKRSTDESMKVVCYYISWGIYRAGTAKFTSENIDPFLCTHIIYAFAKLDEKSLTMQPADPNADIKLESFKNVVEVKKKNPKLKVLLAIGGWTDSQGDKYSMLVRDSDKRKEFVKKAVEFLKQYKFDGLDLDWEFPVCWQADCKAGPESDKDDFADLVKELRKAFDKEKPRLLLTAAVNAGKYVSDRAYDAKSLAKNLDFINVMAYDFHNFMDGKTGHHAPFKYHQGDSDKYSNVMAAMRYWNEERKVPAKKLILGVPAYGRTFTLADPSSHGLFAPVIGPGMKGEFTGENGSLSYMEIRERIDKRGWKLERIAEVGPYAYHDNQWVGFDDAVSVKEKARFVVSKGYGGVMVWELSSDDFRGLLCDVKNPLITALKEGLENGVTINMYSLYLITVVLMYHMIFGEKFT